MSSHRAGRRSGWFRRAGAAALLLAASLLPAGAASAQMLGELMSRIAGPFAGQIAPSGTAMAPLYGSQAGALPHMLQGVAALPGGPMPAATAAPEASGGGDVPDVDPSEPIIEVLIGACAGGAFIGGFSALTAAGPVGGAAVAAGPVLASAVAVGCGMGIATASVSFGAVLGWKRAGL